MTQEEPEPVLLAESAALPTFSAGVPYFVFEKHKPETSLDLSYQAWDGGSEPIAFLTAEADQMHTQLSPDGKYVVCVSNESGRNEVFLKTSPKGKGKWQTSLEGGRWPRWSRKGDELFFVQDAPESALMSVSVSTQHRLRLGAPEKLFDEETTPGSLLGRPRCYGVGLEADRFLMVQRVGEKADRGVRLILSKN